MSMSSSRRKLERKSSEITTAAAKLKELTRRTEAAAVLCAVFILALEALKQWQMIAYHATGATGDFILTFSCFIVESFGNLIAFFISVVL